MFWRIAGRIARKPRKPEVALTSEQLAAARAHVTMLRYRGWTVDAAEV
jgi:hypothetical protein